MEKTFGCCRYVYNWALDLKIKTYQGEKRSMSAVDLCKQLTLLKKDENHLWLNEVSNECLQQSIRCMDSAFTKFFREHTGFPNLNPNIGARTFLRMLILLSLILKTTELRFLSLVG